MTWVLSENVTNREPSIPGSVEKIVELREKQKSNVRGYIQFVWTVQQLEQIGGMTMESILSKDEEWKEFFNIYVEWKAVRVYLDMQESQYSICLKWWKMEVVGMHTNKLIYNHIDNLVRKSRWDNEVAWKTLVQGGNDLSVWLWATKTRAY